MNTSVLIFEKRFFLLLLACVLLAFSATAQSSVAKIKYEEAEEAFTQGQYATTLTRLDEAEKILGSSNPRILYLRIMAADKVVQADPYTNFALLQRLRQQCALYLTKYDNLENNEDKYRDVYKVSESLKQLPASQAVVDARAQSIQAKQQMEANAQKAKAALRASSRHYVDSLVTKYRFMGGLTLEEFWAYNPATTILSAKTKSKTKDGEVAYYLPKDFAKQQQAHQFPLGPRALLVDTKGKVKFCDFCIVSAETPEARNQLFEKIEKDISKHIDSLYTIRSETSGGNISIIIRVPDSGSYIAISRLSNDDGKTIMMRIVAIE